MMDQMEERIGSFRVQVPIGTLPSFECTPASEMFVGGLIGGVLSLTLDTFLSRKREAARATLFVGDLLDGEAG